MKDQAARPIAAINHAVFSLWAGARRLGRWMLSVAGRLGIVDFPNVIGARWAGLVRPVTLDKKAPGIRSRPLRGGRENRGKATAAPPTAEASRTKSVGARDPVRRFVPAVCKFERVTKAAA